MAYFGIKLTPNSPLVNDKTFNANQYFLPFYDVLYETIKRLVYIHIIPPHVMS